MPWHLVSDQSIRDLPVPERFIAYAEAYATAAAALCGQMVSASGTCTWPNAAVVLMLAAHAAELFLKGAVLKRDPSAHLDDHCLDTLTGEYNKRFSEAEFVWNVPFRVEYLGIAEEEIAALRKSTPVPSILYRYPVQRGGEEWNGLFGFEPHSFVSVLEQMGNDFRRIKARLA
jgi:hypothetical protein